MAEWTSDELTRIGTAEELEVASLRAEGTLRKSRTIWVVRVGNDLYVRSVYGRGSDWFQGVQTRHEGHIQAGGVDKDVTFAEVTDAALNNEIDAAYRAKYRRYAASIVESCTSAQARSATLRLVPHQ